MANSLQALGVGPSQVREVQEQLALDPLANPFQFQHAFLQEFAMDRDDKLLEASLLSDSQLQRECSECRSACVRPVPLPFGSDALTGSKTNAWRGWRRLRVFPLLTE